MGGTGWKEEEKVGKKSVGGRKNKGKEERKDMVRKEGGGGAPA